MGGRQGLSWSWTASGSGVQLQLSQSHITSSGRATFAPRGLAGHLYWKAVTPFHNLIFGGMARKITSAAEQRKELKT